MKIFDEVLNTEEEIHEEVTPEKGVEIILEDTETMKEAMNEC